jgi:hypothetical protein
MTRSTLLENCTSIEQVVDLINNGGTSDATTDELVAQYVTDAERENRHMNDEELWEKFTEERLSPHFDILNENGAEYDYQKALKIALSL